MRKKLLCGCVALFSLSIACYGQKIQSQQESQPALRDRYKSLVCAIAFIKTERGTGTGFFIDTEGDLVTAAHVVSTKTFSLMLNQVSFDVAVDKQISVRPQGQKESLLSSTAVNVDKRESSTDLAFIHTGMKPPCFISLGDSKDAEVGDHLLAIGFPGIDNGNPILYEGFLSGRFTHPQIAPVGTVNGMALFPNYEVLKVQMPITPGASGSPIIDDNNKAVGVISEAPMIWTEDLEKISQLGMSAGGSGILLSGFDTTKILGELAAVVHDFETTGSGYAVPVSILKQTRVEVH